MVKAANVRQYVTQCTSIRHAVYVNTSICHANVRQYVTQCTSIRHAVYVNTSYNVCVYNQHQLHSLTLNHALFHIHSAPTTFHHPRPNLLHHLAGQAQHGLDRKKDKMNTLCLNHWMASVSVTFSSRMLNYLCPATKAA
jgi:hypothetical protein